MSHSHPTYRRRLVIARATTATIPPAQVAGEVLSPAAWAVEGDATTEAEGASS
ncbi:hypothetical protein [Georgenia muralis]